MTRERHGNGDRHSRALCKPSRKTHSSNGRPVKALRHIARPGSSRSGALQTPVPHGVAGSSSKSRIQP